jgi:hypothetical protein
MTRSKYDERSGAGTPPLPLTTAGSAATTASLPRRARRPAPPLPLLDELGDHGAACAMATDIATAAIGDQHSRLSASLTKAGARLRTPARTPGPRGYPPTAAIGDQRDHSELGDH